MDFVEESAEKGMGAFRGKRLSFMRRPHNGFVDRMSEGIGVALSMME